MPTRQDLRPLKRRDGYLPLEDHGLIGDGSTAALVGRDGAISWMCVPRFDSDPLFCGLLDDERGGGFRIAPRGLEKARQYYEPDTGVLVTELHGDGGTCRITDALLLRSGCDLSEGVPVDRGELHRKVEAIDGPVELDVEIRPRGDASVRRYGDAHQIRLGDRPDLRLHLITSADLDGLSGVVEVTPGDPTHFTLSWGTGFHRRRDREAGAELSGTIDAWRGWASNIDYEGPRSDLIQRSAITLKLLDHFENGALVAAPTSSLPETIGGERNWDYRYSWIRDAAFSVYALRRVGLGNEAWWFLEWVLNIVERGERPRVLYGLDGSDPAPEREDRELEGYRGSRPVRWGNDAAGQKQHDVYGEMLDCAYQYAARGGVVDEHIWRRLCTMTTGAAREWNEPDHGIWEVRTPGRVFTYSAAMCQVALDRASRIADRFALPGDVTRWRKTADEIRSAILERSWDEERGSLIEHLGSPGGLDASLLSLPLRRVIEADHPKMVATTERVAKELGDGDLVYRYLPEESPDGLQGEEGAFLLCSFWLVDNLALQGRHDEAMEMFESLCGRVNHLGLLPEQVDMGTGEFLGNFPQAFSHVGMISTGVNLARLGSER